MEVRIYVAAPMKEKELAREAAKQLTDAGFRVVSRWLWLHGDKPADDSGLLYDPEVLKREATNDAQDVFNCDVFVLLNTQLRGEETSGKAVETGMAMAWGKPVILVGSPTNVFHYLDVIKVSDVIGAIYVINDWVKEYAKNNPGVEVEVTQ